MPVEKGEHLPVDLRLKPALVDSAVVKAVPYHQLGVCRPADLPHLIRQLIGMDDRHDHIVRAVFEKNRWKAVVMN